MGLWDKIKGEFIDIIEWLDDTRDTLLYRFERYGNEIKYNAKLVVREGQMAAFINEGQLADIFKPGTYTLETKNLPILATMQGWKYGFESPFKAEVYFCSTRQFTTAAIEDNLRGKIGTRIKEVIPDAGIPIIDLEGKVIQLGETLRSRIAPAFDGFGLDLTEVQVQDIGLPEEVEKAIDKAGAMRAIGNMQTYTQYETASAIKDAANNPGGLAAAGVGVGMGFGMGGQLAGAMGGIAAGQAQPQNPSSAPPPLPPQVQFFVAINGQQTGPYDTAVLQQMAQSGQLTRETLVWKQGMASWTAAVQTAELARIFEAVPPPLPA